MKRDQAHLEEQSGRAAERESEKKSVAEWWRWMFFRSYQIHEHIGCHLLILLVLQQEGENNLITQEDVWGIALSR